MKYLYLSIVFFVVLSCGSYVTPGGSANISELADEEISEILSNKPTSTFPAIIAIARIQSKDYTNIKNKRYNYAYTKPENNFSMILTRDPYEDEALEKLNNFDGIKQASPFNKLLLPNKYTSIKDLRIAAAKMKAQMLLVYTFDTNFIINTKNYGPQNVISLGYLKNKEVKVVTTASAAIFDVQTEYLYGLAESTSRTTKKSNGWKKYEDVDALRVENERSAFLKLEKDLADLWNGIYKEYAN